MEPVLRLLEDQAARTVHDRRGDLLAAMGWETVHRHRTRASRIHERVVHAVGGKGITAMSITAKTGRLVASFPVEESDQIMLVTDKGQLIRTQVNGIRIAGRSTQGVIVFDTADDERVVSVERLSEEGNGEE